MRTLELFAGLGGLKLALPSGFEVVAAYDQDAEAARCHELNHGVPVVGLDLASVSRGELARHEAQAWALSPPCQPFTRRGERRDVDDPRCAGFLRLVALLPELAPRRVLVENVPGFHGSRAHALLCRELRLLGHDVRDVSACPTELGFPARRVRQFVVSSADGLAPMPGPVAPVARRSLSSFLDPTPDASLAVPAEVRRRVEDHLVGEDGIVGAFTRSYGRAITGAGPVLWDDAGPRYFSPEEILRLHDFPESFRFPDDMPRRTRWRLAGNSVHVGCVRRVASVLAP